MGLKYLILCMVVCAMGCAEKGNTDRYPNIILILADDLGYGDVSCYSQNPKFITHHIDNLAKEGIRFKDAHSSSAVCSPTRYSILTGQYAWRTDLKSGVLWEWDPPLIDDHQLTLSSMLKGKGYYTAAVGKWHLGWEWPTLDGKSAKEASGANVDYSKAIERGPLAYGFDYYFGDDVPNFPPYTFIENDKVLMEPTIDKPDTIFGNGGEMAEGWLLENVMPSITKKAIEVIDRAADNSGQPFFLYFALTAPHTPIVPTGEFRDKSSVGPYGDYVLEVDWSVGEIMDALERHNLEENTLVIFTSDNGSPARDGSNFSGPVGSVIENFHHLPNGNLRGLKADIWEGGHRIPFIVSWKGVFEENRTDDHTVSSMDIMATVAELLHDPSGGDTDGHSLLSLFYGKESRAIRSRALAHHSGRGIFAVRKGPWKLILSDRSGGFSDNLYPDGFGISTPGQLYDLSVDLEEKVNLYRDRLDIVDSLTQIINEIRNGG